MAILAKKIWLAKWHIRGLHADVSEDYRGQGIGRQILDKVVAFAREKNLKIISLCPYAKSVFDKDPSIADVLRN